jgi:hypothetical protein
MKTKTMLIGGLSAFTLALVGISMASAYQGDYSKQGPNHTTEREATMTQIFNNTDYDSWKKQMEGKGRVTQVINKDNFAKFVEARKLGKEGKIAEADKIRQELGLRTSNGEKFGKGYDKGNDQRGKGMNRGFNNGGNYVDKNGDDTCDNLK